jgi:hypothetical protein
MFHSFKVENFRCFRDLTLGTPEQPLGRVNLIAGKNNVGKTALLEALHIHSYPQSCSVPFTIHTQRGLQEQLNFDADLGAWLFHDRHASQGLTLTSRDEKSVQRTLQIWMDDGSAAREQFPQVERIPWAALIESLLKSGGPRLFLRSEVDGQEKFAVGFPSHTHGSKGMTSSGSEAPWAGPSAFIGSGGALAERDLESFSALEFAKRQDELLASLRILEPRLQRLSLLLLDSRPMIHGDLGSRHLVPVALMGEGIRRLLSILLAITTASGGRVLIDEIENGLHYSVLKDVWLAIAKAARTADAQVFATTHSWECIQAAHRAFKDSPPYDFRYLRLDRRGEDIVVRSFDERMLDTVEKSDLEVR